MFGDKRNHPFDTGIGNGFRRKQVSPGSTINKEGVIDTFYFLTRMPCCDVNLVAGGQVKFVPFPGGLINEITKFFHGDFISPQPGQKVIVSFSENDPESPYISQLIWRPGTSFTAIDYKTIFQIKFAEGDIIRGHRSGAIQQFTDFPTPKIFTGYDTLVDPLGSMAISQGTLEGPLFTPGIKLGDGGFIGQHQPVAVANHNYVATGLGLQPIIDSLLVGPRQFFGTGVQA